MDSGRIFFGQPYRSNTFFFRNTSDDSIFRGTRSVLNMEEPSRKRSFFRSPEELYDEEYFDEQLPEKKRRLTPDQLQLLEKSFESENKLEPERKAQLAKELGLQPRQVAVWFQNRRARWKTKQLETDYDHLKSSYDSLVSDYDSILKQNDNLKSELLALTGKLQQKPTSSDPLPPPRVEDRISTGSDGSAVVDDRSPQLDLDSGDSYFPTHEYPGYTVNDVDDVFAVDQQEAIGWCIWS